MREIRELPEEFEGYRVKRRRHSLSWNYYMHLADSRLGDRHMVRLISCGTSHTSHFRIEAYKLKNEVWQSSGAFTLPVMAPSQQGTSYPFIALIDLLNGQRDALEETIRTWFEDDEIDISHEEVKNTLEGINSTYMVQRNRLVNSKTE